VLRTDHSTLHRRAQFLNIDDARERARRHLPRMVFDYVDGGSGAEITMNANRTAFDEVTFRPRMGEPPASISLSTTVLGQELQSPLLFAPCGLMGTMHPDAESGTVRVAAAKGTIAAISSYSSKSLEHIAAASSATKWFQLYFLGGRAGAMSLVERAEACGYGAIVLTLDTNVPASRERDTRNRVIFPLALNLTSVKRFGPMSLARPRWLWRFVRAGMPFHVANVVEAPTLTDVDTHASIFNSPPGWNDVEWIRQRFSGKVVVKGILTAQDARRAVEVGADAIIVSNHGGRQLDGAPATLRALPEVVEAVAGQVEVYMDGGIRRGSDIAKAMALGARAVFIGRPYLYGLALAGEAGVAAIHDMLTAQLTETMHLLGCDDVRKLDSSWLW
jgi:isopentenyl diphosphate isomerase/L-lactate dehydrogenase-like FMN-dependent dehydrogenase